jgi:O-antigen/teichoic acid export membrane protein
MLDKLKPKSEYTRNILTLVTGTTIAQSIPIIISPILTRLYSPEDFGIFALFIAISSIVGSIVNGRYELAIMLPKKDEDAINILVLGLIITSFISLLLLILIILFNDDIVKLLNNKEIKFWLYLIPVAVFFIGFWNLLIYFHNRKKNYKNIAKTNILRSIITSIIQLSIGYIKQGVVGLITGQMIAQFFANIKLLKYFIKNKILFSKISKVKIIAMAKRYKDFPKYSMLAALLNSLSHYFVNILISIFYNIGILGYYNLVQRILGVPSSLIGNSISKVFFQQALEEKHKTGKAIISFHRTIKKLVIIGIPLFGILFFIVEDLFTVVFGEKWKIAGTYAKILIPFFFMNFVSSPLAIIMTVFEKQKETLLINFLLLISSIIIIFLSYVLNIKFINFLYIFSAVMFCNYAAYIIYYYKLAKGE